MRICLVGLLFVSNFCFGQKGVGGRNNARHIILYRRSDPNNVSYTYYSTFCKCEPEI